MSILEDFIGGRAGAETVIPVFENNQRYSGNNRADGL